MDDLASFQEQCFERDRLGYPPMDLEAIRQGRPQPAPPGAEPDERSTPTSQGHTMTERPSPAARDGSRRSAVFTVRLAHDDLVLLEQRARLGGIAPSSLARNLINIGLRERDGGELAEAVLRVQEAAAQLRAAVP